jgi:hypothetical protein
MALKLNRYFTTDITVQDETLTLRFKRMSATHLIDYSHEIEVLQERLKDEDRNAVKDIYLLNIELLCDQLIDITGLEDEGGNTIDVPSDRDEKRELYDALGLSFINEACNAFSAGAQLGNELEKQDKG